MTKFGRGAVVAAAIALAVAFGLSSSTARADVSPYVAHDVIVNPVYQSLGDPLAPNAKVFGCQAFRPPPRTFCYGPDQIRAAYGIQSLLNSGIDGTGHTIVIVDAFQSPTIATDLGLFDGVFGLPAPPSFTQVAPFGSVPFDPTDANMVGWSAEISLDVQWAHAVAPGASIVLALAKTNSDVDIYNTTKYVIDNNLGDVISQSFGEGESCVDPALLSAEHTLFQKARSRHITLIASSGDQGAAQPNCAGAGFFLSASSPASDPLVTAVGGTNLFAGSYGCANVLNVPVPCAPPFAGVPTGQYISETAWNDSPRYGDAAHGFSGGGFSTIYRRPGYQSDVPGIPNGNRGVPDVSYNAGVSGGVVAFWGVPFGPGAAFVFGGTSAGSPQWAGLTVLANQLAGHRLGFLNTGLYALGGSGSFHDITSGNNNFDTITGYSTAPGWDPVTGWGSPVANQLVPALVATVGSGD